VADYPILTVRPEDLISDETLGSKTKFWFRRDGKRWLFKEAREGTGEDWAEKIAAEVAHKVGISAATVELAERPPTVAAPTLCGSRKSPRGASGGTLRLP